MSIFFIVEIIKETEPSIFLINNYDNTTFSNLQDINSVSDDVLQLNNQTSVLLDISIDANALADAQQAFDESDFEVTNFDDDDSDKLNFDESNTDSLQQAINACKKAIEVLPSSTNDDIHTHDNEVFDDSDYNLDEVFDNKTDIRANSIENIDACIEVGDDDHDQELNEIEIRLSSETFQSATNQVRSVLSKNSADDKRTVNGGKVCEICNKVCKTNFRLKTHLLSHSNDKPFQCTFDGCIKKFKSKIGLKEHEAKHTGKNVMFSSELKCVDSNLL